MASTAPIASVSLIAVTPDGRQLPLQVEIDSPVRAPQGEWSCRVSLTGLERPLPPACGEDALQALCLGLALVAERLRAHQRGGGRLLFGEHGAAGTASSGEEWPLEAYFGWLGSLRAPAV